LTEEIKNLNENFLTYRDLQYRRFTKYIIIATLESLIPKNYPIDPDLYSYATSEYSWGKVQKFFNSYAGSRNRQMPMHWYTEYYDEL
jgi:hypothetical protein